MMMFLTALGGIILVTVMFLGLLYVFARAMTLAETRAEARDCIQNDEREKLRSILLMYPDRLTRDQRRNAELWLARKDGLLDE